MAIKTNPGIYHNIFRYIGIFYDFKPYATNAIEFKIRMWHPIYIIFAFFISLYYDIFIEFFGTFYLAIKDMFTN